MSTRTRLTLYFTLLFGVIVVGLATASYVFVRHSLYSELDAKLRVAVEGTSMSAEHEFDEHNFRSAAEADLQAVLNGRHTAALPDPQILVLQGTRVAAYSKSEHATVDLRAVPAALLKAGGGFNDIRIAQHALPVPKFHTVYQVYAGASALPVREQLRRLGLTLLLLVPVGLMLAALSGYAWARSSLAPLSELLFTIEAVTSTDLSARVPLSRHDDEISRIGKRFNGLLLRLEAALESQRRFMADASHELRTPITVALAAAQVTSRDPVRQQIDSDEALRVIEEQMQRMRRTVEDLLFLSQSDASAPELMTEEMYLDDVASDASRSAQALARARQQRVLIHPLPEAPIQGNPDLLRQVLLILLDNAVKFTPVGGQIELAILRRQDWWVCQVTDNGRGIPAKAQPRIFDRFYRAQSDGIAEATSGSGLGLAVAKVIVERHGGTLMLAQSRPGFTCFEMSLRASNQGEQIPAALHANSLAVKI